MARRKIGVQAPEAGLGRAYAFQSQPPFTLCEAMNVRCRDPFESRARLASRPGLAKAYAQNVSMSFEVPTESFTMDFYPTKDTYLYDINPNLNYGSTLNLLTGTALSGPECTRAILHFDMTAIPNGATITSASLRLYKSTGLGSPGSPMKARVLNQVGWVETQATWNIYSTGNSWSPANAKNPQTGPYLSTPEADWITPSGLDLNFIISGLSALAQTGYATYSKNLHLILMAAGDTVPGHILFLRPREVTIEIQKPKLTVMYEVPV